MRYLSLLLLLTALHAETLVLHSFTLIDGTGRPPVPGAALIVTDGKITFAGPESKLKAPTGAVRIDLSGKYVMPGIINVHGHLGNVAGLVQDPKNFTRENLEKQLKLYASYGVTSVATMGSEQDLIFQVRSEQRSGRPRMARIFTAYRGFTGPGGYPTAAPGMKGIPFEVSTVEQVRKNVAELADKRVDIVKIWVDDHLGRERKIPLELSREIIANAHKHKLRVAAHIFYLDDAKALVEAGLDGLAHSVRDHLVDDALISAMKKRGAWQAAATLTREMSTFAWGKPNPVLNDPFFVRGVEPAVLNTLRSPDYQKRIAADPDFSKYPGFLETAKKNLKRLADAGVKFGFGTDSGPPARFQGFFEHWEMELMADAGLTPQQIITAASKSSAEFLGVSNELGTLEPDHWADLVVLGKNPLDNIRNTRTIESVYIAGNKVK
jgi:imidazolonepropionase-like amidohydrolase